MHNILKNFSKKILSHDLTVYVIIRLTQLYLNIVFFTSKIKINVHKKSAYILHSKEVCFLTLWHARVIIFPKIMRKYGNFTILTSLHKDGKYVEKFVKLYGNKTIRGSSLKGGLSATKIIIKSIQAKKSVVITPDGPKGPKYKINSAITNLASKLKVPVISMSFIASRIITVDSWDQFIIPLPFTKIFINISPPYYFNQQQNNALEAIMNNQVKNLDQKVVIKTFAKRRKK